MIDELEKLVSASLNVSEDLNSPTDLPSADLFWRCNDGVMKIGKALTKIGNKLTCFLCSRSRWKLLQIMLVRTDTRLMIIYTDTDKGFVLDLTDAKRFEFMIEENHEGKRLCRVKIKWDFGSVQLRFVEAQIGTWQRYVLDSFDRIFKTPIPPPCSRSYAKESECVERGESSDEFSTTESGSSRRSKASIERQQQCTHPETLTTTNERMNGERCEMHMGTTSGRAALFCSQRSNGSNVSAFTEKSQLEEENALESTISNHSSQDGSTLSMTSDTDSSSAYEGDISIVPATMTHSLDGNLTVYKLPPSHKQTQALIVDSPSTRSYELHQHKPMTALSASLSSLAQVWCMLCFIR
ncbi:unnamed protein product [Toxocara canis]|uniref:DUF7778 domain-containing protein n=1 Tax=Toxocara canis TaxID=6265 RepID=A0A183UDV0_TOXCA|nr:unnamed protein product [Toxocara canis]